MPAGSPWCTSPPNLRSVPKTPLWHVYDRWYGPLTANPKSAARLALVGTHGMFYAADTLAGALWETVLRNIHVTRNSPVLVAPGPLLNQSVVRISATADDLPLLDLGQPALRDLFPDPNGPEARRVADLLGDPVHVNTHGEAHALRGDLVRQGIAHMPVLCWPSRMHNASNVYLAYEQPMTRSWWNIEDDPIALDSAAGYALIRDAITDAGYVCAPPLATTATLPRR